MIKTLQKQLIRGAIKYVADGYILDEGDWPSYSPKPFVKTPEPGTHADVMLRRESVDYPGQAPLRIYWDNTIAWGKTLQGLGAAVYFITTDFLDEIEDPSQILKIGKASGKHALHSRMLQYSHGWFRQGTQTLSDGTNEGIVCSTNKIVMDSILDYGQRHFYLYAMFIPKKTVQFNGFWFKEVSTMSAEVVERGLVSQFEDAFGKKPICNVS